MLSLEHDYNDQVPLASLILYGDVAWIKTERVIQIYDLFTLVIIKVDLSHGLWRQ